MGPSSVARKPSASISASTRSGGSIRPQPGTSQTPQEMGAAATRECLTLIADLEFDSTD